MVAWQDDEGSFWLSNTLIESLSDREMLKIAQGFKRAAPGRRLTRGAPASEREGADRGRRRRLGRPGHGRLLRRAGPSGVAREIVAEKVEALDRGEVPIHEPGLPELIERNRERLTFTTEIEPLLESARLIFVCVQTPPTHSGDADLSAVQRAAEEIGERRGEGARDEEHRAGRYRADDQAGRSRHLAYVSCPEFLREGSAVEDFMQPDRVVIGADGDDQWAADAVADAYGPLDAPIVRTDVSSAEMIKLASNAFLATKISFINEIANVCDEVGADVTEVARGMGMDQRIGPKFLNAGLGFGGSCFPKDTQALKMLAGNIGYHFQLLSSVIEVNELQKRRVTSKLTKHLGSLEGKRIALLGLAFKPDTDDMSEASSLVLASRLEGEGAEVAAYDPVAGGVASALLPERRDGRLRAGRTRRRRCGRAGDRLAGVRRARLGRGRQADEQPAAGGRPQLPRRRADLLAAGFAYEGIGRPGVEAEKPAKAS